MKNLTTLLVLFGCLSFITTAYAGENGSSSLTAEKLCSAKIDIFNTDNAESLLNLAGGKKLASYQVVLCLHNGDVFKFDSDLSGGFKRIMSSVKEHADPGSMLFLDEMKTTDGEKIAQTGFYLR